MSIKAILFDLDGTLINSPEIIMQGFIGAINEHHPSYQLTKKEITDVLGQTLIRAFDKFSNNENEYQRLVSTFRKITNELSSKMLNTYENAKNVIQYLRKKNYFVGLVTSKSREVVNDNLKSVKLENLFDVIITFEDVVNHKPHAEPLLKALEKTNYLPEETIYIGDHENDCIAGKNANMVTGIMGYTFRMDEVKKVNPNYIFKDLETLKKYF
ncbi:MAG: HAD-IA family hydrolase [Acholeplasma sp.]|nr:HAD-IA family hydrolase [Acholeplasma sp.]